MENSKIKYKRILVSIVLFYFLVISVNAQDVYRTPSGRKYHLATCRMVENVSKRLSIKDAISKYNLQPCKICKPPYLANSNNGLSTNNKAVGVSQSIQYNGKTKKGTRCKHMTRLANGYCYQHTDQNNNNNSTKIFKATTNTSVCGAPTKSGGYCKRKVKNGGYCYQHK